MATVIALVGAITFYSCNPAKNNFATRQYQAVLTKYNIHYNGQKHYDETLEDMEKEYKDDYNELVFVHPAEARGLEDGVPQPTGDFTRSIEKAEKAIQLHSIKKAPRGRTKTAEQREWKTRSEYNPYLHNSWMLMGKALYMNGDFQKAATIFLYISRHFKWLPATVTEAKIWEARCYSAMDWLYEAEDLLETIQPADLTSKELKRQFWIAKSSMLVHRKLYADASAALENAIDVSSGNQKTRLRYLLGQVYARAGEREKAYKVFSGIAGSITTDYRTRINARIAMSEVTPPGDVKKELARLSKLARYESNAEYLDLIYFAQGNLYLVDKDTTAALKAYEKAIENSQNQGIGLAQSELATGLIYYNRGEYAKAQPHYATAVSLLPSSFPDIENIKKRSDILDRYAVYANNVELQDSLLELASMSEEDRMKVCERLAKEYQEEQKKLKAQEEREEYLANAEGSPLQTFAETTQQPQIMTASDQDAAWYFYNEQTVRAGRTQFQRVWGNRRLEDNWRRRDKTSVAFETPEETEEDTEENDGETDMQDDEGDDGKKQEVNKSADPAYPEYYLAQIPMTDDQKQQANEIIMEGLYNMGIILKNEIKNAQQAIEMFQRLLKRYPDNIYRLDVYEEMYLIYAREGDLSKAEEMRLLILKEFPETPLGKAMVHPDYLDRLKRQKELEDSLYVSAYNNYLDNNNAKVHAIVNEVKEDFSTSSLMPKFLFIDALAYATDGNREKFKEGMQELLARYPETDLTPVASGMLSNINAGRKLGENVSNLRGMIWDVKLGESEGKGGVSEAQDSIVFELDEHSPQLFIFLFPSASVSTNQLLYDVGRHNFETYMARDFDIEVMNTGNIGLIIVSGLNNRAEAQSYESKLAMSQTLQLPPEVKRIIISANDFRKIITEGLSIGDYLRSVEGKQYEDAQRSVLDDEEYEIESLY